MLRSTGAPGPLITELALFPLQPGGSRRSAEAFATSATEPATRSLVYGRIGGEEIDIHDVSTDPARSAIAQGLAQLVKGGVTIDTALRGLTRFDGIGDFLKSVASEPDLAPEAMEAEFSRLHRSLSRIQRMIGPDEITRESLVWQAHGPSPTGPRSGSRVRLC